MLLSFYIVLPTMANVLLLDPERVHPLSTGKHTTLYKTVPDMPVGSCGSGDALDTLEGIEMILLKR